MSKIKHERIHELWVSRVQAGQIIGCRLVKVRRKRGDLYQIGLKELKKKVKKEQPVTSSIPKDYTNALKTLNQEVIKVTNLRKTLEQLVKSGTDNKTISAAEKVVDDRMQEKS